MSQVGYPPVRRMLDLDSIGAAPDDVALGKLNITYTGAESDAHDEQGQELMFTDRTPARQPGERKRRRRAMEAEENTKWRVRRLIVMVVASVPFLLAVVLLVAVTMLSHDKAAIVAEAATVANVTDTIEIALGMTSSPPTYSPTSEIAKETTDLPTPRPITAEPSQTSTSSKGATDGGLRATPSPAPTNIPTNREVDTMSSPTSSAPISSPPTTAPTGFCVGEGMPCPKKRVALCCSDVCVRDDKSGEKVCASIPKADTVSEVEGKPPRASTVTEAKDKEKHESASATCVKRGLPCPNKRLALCCSDRCRKDSDTGERSCA